MKKQSLPSINTAASVRAMAGVSDGYVTPNDTPNTYERHYTFPQDPDAFVRANQCAHQLGIGLSTYWKWVAAGKVEKGVRVGAKTTVWRAGYIRELQQKLIAAAAGEV